MTQSSVIGNSPVRVVVCTSNNRGFTLIELLVVLVIVAIAAAGVMFALPDRNVQNLNEDAERLAAVLQAARDQSQAMGRVVSVRFNERGFKITGLIPGQSVADAYQWNTHGIMVTLIPSNKQAIALVPDPISGKQVVVLSTSDNAGASVYVATDGISPYAVYKVKPF